MGDRSGRRGVKVRNQIYPRRSNGAEYWRCTRTRRDASGGEQRASGHPRRPLPLRVSAELVQPLGRALISRKPPEIGGGGGFSLHYEARHFLIAAEISGGRFGHDDTYSNPFMVALRAGPVFGSGAYALYLAVGPALLGDLHPSKRDE